MNFPARSAVFVTRLDPATISEDVMLALKDLNLENIVRTRLKIKYEKNASYHVLCMEVDCNTLLVPSIWPTDILVTKFYGRLRPDQHYIYNNNRPELVLQDVIWHTSCVIPSELNAKCCYVDNLREILQKEAVCFQGNRLTKRFIHTNIRSIRSNLQELIAVISNSKIHVDLVILTEIWVYKEEISLYGINYYEIAEDCRTDNRSGGVIIHMHKKSGFVLYKKGMRSAEMVMIFNHLDVIGIMAVYRAHGFSISDFYEEFEALVWGVCFRNLYIVGDLNIDLKGSATGLGEYLNIMADNGMEWGIDVETIFGSMESSCIVIYFFRNNSEAENFFYVYKYLLTDHMPIICSIYLRICKENKCDENAPVVYRSSPNIKTNTQLKSQNE